MAKRAFIFGLLGIFVLAAYRAITQLFPFYNPLLFAGLSIVLVGTCALLIWQVIRWRSKRRQGAPDILFKRALATGIDILILITGASIGLLAGALSSSLVSRDKRIYIARSLVIIVGIAVSWLFLTRDKEGTWFSVGKRVMGLRVINESDQGPCTIKQSIVRNVLLYLYGLTTFLLADPASRLNVLKIISFLLFLLILADVLHALGRQYAQTWLERFSRTRTLRK